MADENIQTPDEIDQLTGAKSGKPMLSRILIIVPIAILVLAVQSVMAYYTLTWLFFSEPLSPVSHAEEVVVAETKGGEESYSSTGEVYQIEDIIVNPAGTQGRRFLVVSLGFEVSEKKVLVALAERETQIRDAMITLLSSKNLEYLADVMNREPLREEIRSAANRFIDKGEVIRVYFIGYVLQ